MADDHDWRLDTDRKEYLVGATVIRKAYRGEHDHCSFCWAKFVDPAFSDTYARLVAESPDILTEGYAALGAGPEGQDDYHWICDRCFADFHERFAWRVAQ